MLAAGCAAVLDAHRGADSRGNGGCFEATTERRPILRFVNEPLRYLGRCFYPWRSALWRTGIVATGCDPNYHPLDTCSKFCAYVLSAECVRRPPPLMKVVAARRAGLAARLSVG